MTALIDAHEVARLLGVSKRSVYDIPVSALPHVIVGARSKRWKPEDVERYVREKRRVVVRLKVTHLHVEGEVT